MQKSLEGKVVVITGASRGLGEALAQAFGSEGCKLVLAARSSSDLERVAKTLRTAGVDVEERPTDVTQQGEVKELADQAVKRFGTVDIWINNAGIIYKSPVTQIDTERMKKVFEVNVYGPIFGCMAAFDIMAAHNGGHIINILSVSGLEPKLNETVYCASKYAMRGFGEALRLESLQKKVKVTSVYPGGMKTHLFDEYSNIVDTGTFMDPVEMARQIVSLASTPPNMGPSEIVIRRI